jgi:CBS domain-containing protein
LEALHAPVTSLRIRNHFAVPPTTTLAEVVATMNREDVGCLAVVDAGRLVGIITERNLLLEAAPDFENMETRLVTELMVRDPVCVHRDATLAEALRALHVGRFRHLPLVADNGEFVAIISVRNILEYIVDHFPGEVLNLPPSPIRGPMNAREGA